MSLQDLLSLADDTLHDLFRAKQVPDPSKARAPILKGIERTTDQFASATPVKGKKWFKIKNGVVELNLPFAIDGKSTFYLHSARFLDFLAKLKEKVTAGDLDKEITAGTTGPKAAPRDEGDKPGRPGWTPERRAAFAATVAAKKAARGK